MIAVGTMTWGRESSEDEARRMYSLARERGVVWFDSASSYSDGEAERILGRCLRDDPKRDEVKISTKGGYRGEDIREELRGSLERLGVERVALYLHHHWARHGDLGSAWDLALAAWRWGLSNCSAWQIAAEYERASLLDYNTPDAIQILYNLAKRGAETELIPWARYAGVKVFAYSPLAAGLLTGKYRYAARGSNKWRLYADERYRRRFADRMVPDSEGEYLPRGYYAAAHDLDMVPAQLAISWVMSHPHAAVIPIVGARTAAQLDELLGARQLDAETWRTVGAMFPSPPPATDRLEEAE
jgi:aryl-alcohol dehydrogenase-like predicted oxidoreductase